MFITIGRYYGNLLQNVQILSNTTNISRLAGSYDKELPLRFSQQPTIELEV